MKKAAVMWSGGKDAALALYKVLIEREVEVVALMTTFVKDTIVTTVHNIPLHLIEEQAESIGLPLIRCMINEDLHDYNPQIRELARKLLREQNISVWILGDIFRGIGVYRRKALNLPGVELLEPLSGMQPEEVMDFFNTSGFRAKIIVVHEEKLDRSFLGKELTPEVIRDFPRGVNLCGEGGEYHSLVYSGPVFKSDIPFRTGEDRREIHPIRLINNEVKKFVFWKAELL